MILGICCTVGAEAIHKVLLRPKGNIDLQALENLFEYIANLLLW